MDIIDTIFGQGKDLTVAQMSARAVVIYFIALVFIRISGRRTFGKRSSFDNTIVIIGASAFVPTVVCSLVLVLLHRGIAMLTLSNKKLAKLIEGEHKVLYKDGKVNEENLRVGLMSKDDLEADVRVKANKNKLSEVKEVHLESTGEVSVIK
jgi:uncharacterized membrane protein YcaP (DUF421 family)